MAAAAIGWYGPLIDLSKASFHVGDYVQLLVFIYKSSPVQYKLWKNGENSRGGGETVRIDVQVGDETRSYFPVSIWQKPLGSTVVAGDIVLLQNVKITRFRDTIEARTLQCSLLQCLVPSKELLLSKGVEELMRGRRIGIVAKDKLHKVIEWALRFGLTSFNGEHCQSTKRISINWKMEKEVPTWECTSLVQLKHLPDASRAIFRGSVGEIFLPITWRHLPESEAEKMFISRRINMLEDNNFMDDLITTGCQLCGSLLSSDSGPQIKQNIFPTCAKSSNGLHVLSRIYRSFMLYVWDESDYIPLLVANKAAELLFGNIKAEKVYSSYQRQKQAEKSNATENLPGKRVTHDLKVCERIVTEDCSLPTDANRREAPREDRGPNYCLILLTMLKSLLKHGENSPLKFSVKVNSTRETESGKYEMLCVSIGP